MGGIAALDDDVVAIVDAGFDHGIALDLQRVVLSVAQQRGRHVEVFAFVGQRLDRHARSDLAIEGQGHFPALSHGHFARTPKVGAHHVGSGVGERLLVQSLVALEVIGSGRTSCGYALQPRWCGAQSIRRQPVILPGERREPSVGDGLLGLHIVGQAGNLQRACPVGQSLQKPALLERCDQAMDARF